MLVSEVCTKLNLSESAVNKLIAEKTLRVINGEIRSADVLSILRSNSLMANVSRLRKQDQVEVAAAEQALIDKEEKRTRLFRELSEAKQNGDWENAVKLCDSLLQLEETVQ